MNKNFTPKEVIGIVLLCVGMCVGFATLIISEMSINNKIRMADKNGVRICDSIRIAWLERDLKNRTIELVDFQQGWAEENVSARYKDSVGYKQMLETKFKAWFYSSKENQSAVIEKQKALTRKYEGIVEMLKNKYKK